MYHGLVKHPSFQHPRAYAKSRGHPIADNPILPNFNHFYGVTKTLRKNVFWLNKYVVKFVIKHIWGKLIHMGIVDNLILNKSQKVLIGRT